MKYKILVASQNSDFINDLYLHPNLSLDYITTSLGYQDMRNHIKYVNPDLFLYYMDHESNEFMNNIASIRKEALTGKIPVVIICEPLAEGFNHADLPGGEPNLLLEKPFALDFLGPKLLSLLNSKNIPMAQSADNYTADNSLNSELSSLSASELLKSIEKDLGNFSFKKQILIIDDAPAMLKMLKHILDDKYDVATAVSGKLARRYLSRKTVDLILLDYDMPEEDGPTVLRSLRETPACADIPVIFLTGVNDVSKIQRALSLKPQGYLLKPIEREKLLTSIEDVLG